MENHPFTRSEYGIAVYNISPSTPKTVLSHNDQHLTHSLKLAIYSFDLHLPVIIHIANRPYYYCF